MAHPQWSCDAKGDGQFRKYSAADSAVIEALYARGSPDASAPTTLGFSQEFKYVFDFGSMTQTNASTGKKRKLQRDAGKSAGAKTGQCVVCTDEKPLTAFSQGCTCVCCDGCAKEHIAQELAQGKFNHGGAVRIHCPCHTVIADADMQRVARPKDFNRYSDLLTRRLIEGFEDFVYCKGPRCGGGQLHDGGKDAPIVRCHECNHRQCFSCEVPWHQGEKCDEYQARRKLWAAEGFETTVAMLDAMSAQCPKCKVRVQKDGEGTAAERCDHMTCGACSYQFCWRCLCDMSVVLAPRTGGNHHHKESCRHYFAKP